MTVLLFYCWIFSEQLIPVVCGWQPPRPVAVCHIHRRRGVLWRDVLQPRLDPGAGFGEYLVSEGLARVREEVWWTPDSSNPRSASAATAATKAAAQTHHHSTGVAGSAPVGAGDDSGEPFPALKRLLDDRERLLAAEQSAELAKRGAWGSQQQEEADHGEATAAIGRVGNAAKGLGERSVGAVRALVTFFFRRPK